MNTEEIVDYVMTTPHNTNKAILRQMIEANGGSDGGNIMVVNLGSATSGNGGIALTTGTRTKYSGFTGTPDKTHEEIIAALESGMIVEGVFDATGQTIRMRVNEIDGLYIYFTAAVWDYDGRGMQFSNYINFYCLALVNGVVEACDSYRMELKYPT